jgi:hypothetical protein
MTLTGRMPAVPANFDVSLRLKNLHARVIVMVDTLKHA